MRRHLPLRRLRSRKATASRQRLSGIRAPRASADDEPPSWPAGCPGQWLSTCAAAVAAAPGVSQRAPEVFDTPPCTPTETLARRSAQPSPSIGIAQALSVAIVGDQCLPSSHWLWTEPKGTGPFVAGGCPEQWQRRLRQLRQRATVLLLLLPQPPGQPTCSRAARPLRSLRLAESVTLPLSNLP